MQTSKYSSGVNTCEYIILHHTGGTLKLENQVRYLCNSTAKVSCHYLVGQGGEVVQISDERKRTWHAGKSKREGKTDLNRYSIGIEVVSDGYIYTDVQKRSLEKLVVSLMEKFNIPTSKVIRHKDISGYRGKRDLSDQFWNKKFKSFDEYKKSFITEKLLRMFYEGLYEKEFGGIKKDDRVIKSPEALSEKIKGLSEQEKEREIGFFIAFGLEKLKKLLS